MVQRAFLTLIIGLGLGALIGVLLGWFLPIQDVSAGFDKLHPAYKAEYTIMVGASYANNGDWDLAQARLGKLAISDIPAYIVSLSEQAINSGGSPNDIRNLVGLAVRFGYTTPAMQLYIPPGQTGQ